MYPVILASVWVIYIGLSGLFQLCKRPRLCFEPVSYAVVWQARLVVLVQATIAQSIERQKQAGRSDQHFSHAGEMTRICRTSDPTGETAEERKI